MTTNDDLTRRDTLQGSARQPAASTDVAGSESQGEGAGVYALAPLPDPAATVHTPLPWKIDPVICGGRFEGFAIVPACYVETVKWSPIASQNCYVPLNSDCYSEAEKRANARLIVTAVNCHAELLAACKEALRFFGEPRVWEGWEHEDGTPVNVKAISVAIAKAETK